MANLTPPRFHAAPALHCWPIQQSVCHSPAFSRSISNARRLRSGGFAVVINTWRRPALLRRSVAHYSACGGVDAVHVVWSEPRPLPPETLRGGVLGLNGTRRGGAGVRFEINDADSLNNRFRPIRGLVADAVFSVDDDLIVPCSTLRFAFSVWQSASSAMVGFVPRMHWLTNPVCFESIGWCSYKRVRHIGFVFQHEKFVLSEFESACS